MPCDLALILAVALLCTAARALAGGSEDPLAQRLMARLSYLPHLLVAQAFIPPTERTEAAGFDFPGDNYAIRAELLRRLNATPVYRTLFGQVFPEVLRGAPIDFDMFGKVIAEFEFTLVFADAPIDQFARGQKNALTAVPSGRLILVFQFEDRPDIQ